MSAPVDSLPPSSGDLPPLRPGDLVTPTLARQIEEDLRRPWHRAKWLTTTIGQISISLCLAAAFLWLREADVIRDGLMYLALLTGGGQLTQGWVDREKARSGK